MYNCSMSPRQLALPLVVLIAVALTACESREVEKVLKVTDVQTGWYDAGIVDGQNKIVPTISFHLQNASDEPIDGVQINAVFRQINDERAWGDRLIRGVGSNGLGPGATGPTLVVRSPRGYTGLESRLTMLKNSNFVDVKVDLFARHGSRTWMKIGEHHIERKLLTE